ncbi:unnamed protein product, partial [Ectocarpus fasciculatus]
MLHTPNSRERSLPIFQPRGGGGRGRWAGVAISQRLAPRQSNAIQRGHPRSTGGDDIRFSKRSRRSSKSGKAETILPPPPTEATVAAGEQQRPTTTTTTAAPPTTSPSSI